MTGGREPPLPNIEKSTRREFADKLGDDTEKFLHNWDKWYTSSPRTQGRGNSEQELEARSCHYFSSARGCTQRQESLTCVKDDTRRTKEFCGG